VVDFLISNEIYDKEKSTQILENTILNWVEKFSKKFSESSTNDIDHNYISKLFKMFENNFEYEIKDYKIISMLLVCLDDDLTKKIIEKDLKFKKAKLNFNLTGDEISFLEDTLNEFVKVLHIEKVENPNAKLSWANMNGLLVDYPTYDLYYISKISKKFPNPILTEKERGNVYKAIETNFLKNLVGKTLIIDFKAFALNKEINIKIANENTNREYNKIKKLKI
jgi:hypothetical protein